ncbi:MAG: DUF2807 domain-containing protein [Candidatus Eremiobacterota bacterium]
MAGPFDEVKVHGGLEVGIACGVPGHPAVDVCAESNLLPMVETRIQDGVLHIGTRPGASPTRPIKVSLMVGTLAALSLSGGVQGYVAAIQADRLRVDASGGSSLTLQGGAHRLDVSATAGSHVNAGGLIADEVRASLGGGCHGVVHARQGLDAQVTGGSSLICQGNPTNWNTRVDPGSEIQGLPTRKRREGGRPEPPGNTIEVGNLSGVSGVAIGQGASSVVQGDLNVDGDFVGGHSIVVNMSAGDITVGDLQGVRGLAIGRGASAVDR